jgi:hypothetical protein
VAGTNIPLGADADITALIDGRTGERIARLIMLPA